PPEVQRYIAERLNLSLSRVEGVIDFYDYLSPVPRETPEVQGAYRIITKQCVGCTACQRVCPVECIEGIRKRPHRIDGERCIACGACFKACKFSAILRPTAGSAVSS
ncbi:MAG: 4Fe-4S binding protein, partial [Bacillota bacterium]|nr:4Fe-4S binding protein [Bacillota bacterium]